MSNRNEFQTLIGKNLRSLRIKNKYTVEQLGLESGIGYSQVSRIELGKRNPTAFTLYLLSKTLNVCPCEFYKTTINNPEVTNDLYEQRPETV